MEIGPSEFVGARSKVLYLTRATCKYKKQGISPSFKLKIRKILSFGTFSDLWLSDGQNWSEQETKLIHASRPTHGYQNIGVSLNSLRYGFSSKYINKYVYE